MPSKTFTNPIYFRSASFNALPGAASQPGSHTSIWGLRTVLLRPGFSENRTRAKARDYICDATFRDATFRDATFRDTTFCDTTLCDATFAPYLVAGFSPL